MASAAPLLRRVAVRLSTRRAAPEDHEARGRAPERQWKSTFAEQGQMDGGEWGEVRPRFPRQRPPQGFSAIREDLIRRITLEGSGVYRSEQPARNDRVGHPRVSQRRNDNFPHAWKLAQGSSRRMVLDRRRPLRPGSSIRRPAHEIPQYGACILDGLKPQQRLP